MHTHPRKDKRTRLAVKDKKKIEKSDMEKLNKLFENSKFGENAKTFSKRVMLNNSPSRPWSYATSCRVSL